MYLIFGLVVTMAGLHVVLTVDVDSVCILDSSSPMMSSMGTYKITFMDRVDLGKIKSGKMFIFRGVLCPRHFWESKIVVLRWCLYN